MNETLHAYHDGELTPEEAARFEKELAADPELRTRLDALAELDAALGTLPGHDAGPGFAEGVVAASRRSAGRGLLLRIAAPLAVAAAALVAVGLSLRAPDHAPAPETDPTPAALVYTWEADTEIYGTPSADDLEDRVLAELDAS